MDEELSDDELILDCIGVDDRIHFCKANSDKTLCGIPVKRKKILKFDFDKFYSCSDCRWQMFEFLKSWFKSNAIQETKESKESINFRDLDVDDIVYYGGRTFFLDTVEELEPDIFLYNFSDRDYEYSLWFSIVVGNDFVNYTGGSFFTYDILEGDGYSDDFDVNDITISETFSRI